jgi:hypothetical protein
MLRAMDVRRDRQQADGHPSSAGRFCAASPFADFEFRLVYRLYGNNHLINTGRQVLSKI